MNRISIWNLDSNERMTTLVICSVSLLLVGHHDRATLRAHQNLVFRPFEVLHRNRFLVEARGTQCGFVDQVRKVGPGKARGASGNYVDVDIVAQRNLAGMNGEDSFPSLDVRPLYDHPTVKSSGTQQRRIENVRPVSRRNKNHSVV